MAFEVIKIAENGHEAKSQTFDTQDQAQEYLNYFKTKASEMDGEVISWDDGMMELSIQGRVFKYEIRGTT